MVGSSRPLAALDTLNGYRQSFMDVVLWKPIIEQVCRWHGWTCDRITPGFAGTFPTFVVDERWVVKFFGLLFDGDACWQVEQEAAGLIAGIPNAPAARLLASGSLEGEPCWRYLVFENIAGISIGEVYEKIPLADKLSLARWLGGWLPAVHNISVPETKTALPALSLDRARGWFSARNAEDLSTWPPHLAKQVEAYLSANDACLQYGCESFIHADLTRDHILGRLEFGRWETLAVIDFGDAMQGNIYYELAALHLDLFDCDRQLLAAFLQAYGLPQDPDFTRKAMVTSLMHQFDIYGHLFACKTELRQARTLDELVDRLWDCRY